MFKELNTMEVFFQLPKQEFSVRETAKILKVAPATASKELADLASSGLLTCRDERLAKLYSANINSEVYKDLKKYYTIKKLRESGFLEAVNKSFASSVILLCGPAAAGSDVESDSIDILVISGKKETIADKTVFEQKLKRQLRIFAAASFSEVAQDFLKEVGNWTVIQGSLPLLSVVSGKSDYVPKKPSKPESLHRKYIQ